MLLITRGGRKRVGRGGEGSLVFLIKVCLFFYSGRLLGLLFYLVGLLFFVYDTDNDDDQDLGDSWD